MFREIYPTPSTERKKIIDFNEFNESLVDQAEGFIRINTYLHALMIFNLFASIGYRSFLVVFSTIWFLFLYWSHIRKYRLTFTEERLILRRNKESKRVNYIFGIIGLLVFIGYFLNLVPSSFEIQDVLIPRILPALLIFLLSVIYPPTITHLDTISLYIPAIIFFWFFLFSQKNEDLIIQSSYKITKSVLISKKGSVNAKGVMFFVFIGIVQISLNIIGMLTQIFIFDLVAFFLFPVFILVVSKFRNTQLYEVRFFNPFGKIINPELLINDINLQRLTKAISNVFDFLPHPFGQFPYRIVETEEFSKFQTGLKPITRSFIPLANTVGAIISFISTLLASIVLIVRSPNSFGAILFGSPLFWVTYYGFLKLFARFSQQLTKSSNLENIFFNSKTIGYESNQKLWISSILNLETINMSRQFRKPLRWKNSIQGDFTNWKLIVIYSMFLLIYGVLAQWIRFGALNAEGLYKLGLYYYTQIINFSVRTILTKPVIILSLGIVTWFGVIWFLPTILAYTRLSLKMTFGKDTFVSHQSEEIHFALFLSKMIASFKFYTLKRYSANVRPSYFLITVDIEYVGFDKGVTIKLGNTVLELNGEGRVRGKIEARLDNLKQPKSVKINVKPFGYPEFIVSEINLSPPGSQFEIKLPNDSILTGSIKEIIFMD